MWMISVCNENLQLHACLTHCTYMYHIMTKIRPICCWLPRQLVPRQFVYGHFVYDTSSTDFSSTTVYQRVGSYTSNFFFSKSLFSSISTSTYTMIRFYQSRLN